MINTCLFSQTSINYNPKSLERELKKFIPSEVELNELIISSKNAISNLKGKFFSISAPYATIKYIYVGRVIACRSGGCSVKPELIDETESDYFDYFIFFDAFCVVQHVKVYNYQASYGVEITSSSWLKQFKNYDGKSELTVGKNVDAIAGATVSADAISVDIDYVTKKLRDVFKR